MKPQEKKDTGLLTIIGIFTKVNAGEVTMSWKDILKVDLREARTLGRKFAPEEMSAGKEKITIEKKIIQYFEDSRNSKDLFNFGMHRKVRTGRIKSEELKDKLYYALKSYGVEVHEVSIKTQKDREDTPAYLDDSYPLENAEVRVKYSSPQNKNETFTFELPTMQTVQRVNPAKKVQGTRSMRSPKQYEYFDRKQDAP